MTISPTERLLWDFPLLAAFTSVGVRTLRAWDASRNIPGRVTLGRRVLFRAETIREWVRAGMPDRVRWEALQKQAGKL